MPAWAQNSPQCRHGHKALHNAGMGTKLYTMPAWAQHSPQCRHGHKALHNAGIGTKLYTMPAWAQSSTQCRHGHKALHNAGMQPVSGKPEACINPVSRPVSDYSDGTCLIWSEGVMERCDPALEGRGREDDIGA